VTTKRTRITSVVSQSGTLIRQSVNVQITFDDTCHVVYIVTNNKRLFSFKYVHISVLHYHPTLYACAFAHTHVHDRKITFSHKRTFILGIDTHVHDRKRTFAIMKCTFIPRRSYTVYYKCSLATFAQFLIIFKTGETILLSSFALFLSYHLEIFIKNFQQWCLKLVIRTTGI
jgi:hypothetical protein